MVEIVFVIIILGIVSSIGAEMIADVYEGYILQRAQHRASVKTDIATTQIANRLRYAIPGTVYRIKSDGSYESVETSLSADGSDYIGIQWVGTDNDSFIALKDDDTGANRRPGWSGFCDLDNSSRTNLNSPGSNFNIADTIIQNLSKDSSGNAKSNLGMSAVFFPGDNQEHNIADATSTADLEDDLSLDDDGAVTFVEHYKLAWSSYALVVEDNDLFLYYNFEPTPQTPYTNGQKELLMKNITTFKFKAAGQTIRIKICKEEQISEDVNVTSCKEKAVF